MNEDENDLLGYNRRDFLKGGSVATLMTMLGGVELLAAPATSDIKPTDAKVKVAVIGVGSWGREILNTLGRLPMADVAAVCEVYPASLKRAATAAPNAVQTSDYKTILANDDIKAVIIATPTHLHKKLRWSPSRPANTPTAKRRSQTRSKMRAPSRLPAKPQRPRSFRSACNSAPIRSGISSFPSFAPVHWAARSWRAVNGTKNIAGARLLQIPSARKR